MTGIDPAALPASPPVSVARLASAATTLSGLGKALADAAPDGGFEAVLARVGGALSSLDPGGGPPAAAAPGAGRPAGNGGGGFVSTASLLGVGGPAGATPGGPGGAAVVADALRYLGVPYQWGGTTPAGLDCSGLVQRVYRDLGIGLPRTSEEQATAGVPVATLADAQPGDLVFFPGSDGTAAAPGHVGIYLGHGQMIDAPHTGTDVQVQPVGHPTAIRRILPGTGTGAGTGTRAAAAGTRAEPAGGIPAGLGVPAGLAGVFEQAGAASGVPPALLAAVAKQESGFDPRAVSPAGAEGLMQLMPATAAGLGVDPFDPAQAVSGAASLLGGYLRQYGGSVPLALAAYNAGPAAVARYGGVPPFPETQDYVQAITASLGGAAA